MNPYISAPQNLLYFSLLLPPYFHKFSLFVLCYSLTVSCGFLHLGFLDLFIL